MQYPQAPPGDKKQMKKKRKKEEGMAGHNPALVKEGVKKKKVKPKDGETIIFYVFQSSGSCGFMATLILF